MNMLSPLVWRRPSARERGDLALSEVDLAGDIYRQQGGVHEAHHDISGLVQAAAGQRESLLARDAVANEWRVHRLQQVAGVQKDPRETVCERGKCGSICRWGLGHSSNSGHAQLNAGNDCRR